MPPEEEKDLRATLTEAYDKEVSEDESDAEPEIVEGSPEDAVGDEQAAPIGDEEVSDGAGATEGEEAGDPKFLPPEGDEQGGEPAEGDVASVGPEERVPVAWKGEAKQKWAEVPAEVRQEVIRREKEVNEVLRESASSRQFQDAFERTVAPFQQFIAADGGNPLQATHNLMQTAAVLRVGSPQQKAQTVAQIVQQFGVDIEALDNALAGAPVQGGNGAGNGGMGPEVQQYIAQQMAPVQQFMGGLQQRVQQHNQQQQTDISSEIEAFENDPKYPFYEDLREDMALLFERADRTGQKLTLGDAYEQAARLNPKVWDIVNKQQAAKVAQKNSQSLEAKKRAAASLRGSAPVVESKKTPATLRGGIEAAWDQVSSGNT